MLPAVPVLLATLLVLASGSARALEVIVTEQRQDRLDLTVQMLDRYSGRGDRLQVETAPGADGLVSRMEVKAGTSGTDPSWAVFALKNPTDRAIERWLVAERYMIVGSGLVWPDLDAGRIAAVTPSVGFVPQRIPSDRVDIFGLTIAPGATVTFVAELASDRFPRLQIWDPLVYQKRLREQSLFNGILLGITGVIAVFLTVVFAANHKAIFPSAALLAWSVLAYLAVDFGFWNRIFQLPESETALYRAASEAAIVASLLVFFYTFLRLGLWYSWIKLLLVIWMLGQALLVLGAVIDPPLAATFARCSFALFAGLGTPILLYFALRGVDRALTLVPAWLLLLVWIFAAGVAVSGRLNGDLVAPGLVSGLVLILLLISFTVTQYAFQGLEPGHAATSVDLPGKALAIEAAGAAVFEWSSRRDEVQTGSVVEQVLGLSSGQLSCRSEDWLKHLHPADRDRFRQMLTSVQERNGGSLNLDLRMRRPDGSYRWFELRSEAVPQADQRSLRCIGLLRDITSAKRSRERLVQDAVRDNLTGLPNRELFLDRLSISVERARNRTLPRPTVLILDIDRFKSVNTALGHIAGDSMLLTIARRLARHLQPDDTLARLGGDQFAILIASEHDPRDVAMLAERVRRALRSPMKISGKDIVLTGSIGIAVYDGGQRNGAELLAEAESAMFRAKRAGTDRIEIFQASMRAEHREGRIPAAELKHAVEQRQYAIVYRPVVRLSNDDLAGFESDLRWSHPKLASLGPAEAMQAIEDAGIAGTLTGQLVEHAATEIARWQKILPRPDAPLFIAFRASSRQLLRPELVQELRLVLGRGTVPRGCLRLHVPESLVMENPEQAGDVLDMLRQAGAGIVLDEFATGISSMQHLVRLSFDAIKLDRMLIHEAGHEEESAILVRSMVALAHEMQRSVQADGVDQPEDAGFLRSIRCDLGSGALYGDPMSDRDVAGVLEEIRRTERRSERSGLMEMLRGLARGRAAEGKGDAPQEPPREGRTRSSRAAPAPEKQRSRSRKGASEGKGARGNGASRPHPDPAQDANGTGRAARSARGPVRPRRPVESAPNEERHVQEPYRLPHEDIPSAEMNGHEPDSTQPDETPSEAFTAEPYRNGHAAEPPQEVLDLLPFGKEPIDAAPEAETRPMSEPAPEPADIDMPREDTAGDPEQSAQLEQERPLGLAQLSRRPPRGEAPPMTGRPANEDEPEAPPRALRPRGPSDGSER